ncbi:MAG: MarR family transcriptional regulator [Rhodoferax sp.]|nr:MarR family transcriptional regulator [Actinomycetota bacterium]
MENASTRWLDPQEQQAWRSYVRAVRLVDEVLRRGLEEHELSHPEYEILVRLSEAPGRALRMSELADEVVNSRSRLTHTVNRLERAGWVARRPCPQDGRGVECLLTDAGFTTLEAAAHTHVRGVREVLIDPLTRAEFLALGESLTKVANRIDPAGRCAV